VTLGVIVARSRLCGPLTKDEIRHMLHENGLPGHGEGGRGCL
jgi:hypothetical protein